MAKYEEKFLVINLKRFDELNNHTRFSNCGCRSACCEHEPIFPVNAKEIESLVKSLKRFNKAYKERVSNKPDPKYYVCNQDEDYSQKVIDVILSGEDQKQAKKEGEVF